MTAALMSAFLAGPAWVLWDMHRKNRSRILATVPDLDENSILMNKVFLDHASTDLIANPGQHTELW